MPDEQKPPSAAREDNLVPETVIPPKSVSLLLRLFAGERDFAQIEGDMIEEFQERVLRSGERAARNWYRQEAVRNACVLIGQSRLLFATLAAVLSVAVIRLVTHPFFIWLRLQLSAVPRTIGLGWVLFMLFQLIVAGMLGFVASLVLSARGSIVRVFFTVFLILRLVYILLPGGYYHLWIAAPRRIPVDLVTTMFVITAFWTGSLMSEPRQYRPT